MPGRQAFASIFIRFYGGLLICIFAVATLTWFGLQQVNEWRAERYRERMATGVFRLIALGAARHEGSQRDEWLEQLGHLMDAHFSVVPADKEHFSRSEMDHLEHGRAVVRLDEVQNLADIYARIPGAQARYVKTRMIRVSEQQAKGMAVLFLDEMKAYPVDQQEAHLKELRPFFGFPVKISHIDELGVDNEQRARLVRKEIVLVLKEGNSPNSSSVRILAPMGQAGDILELGPMYLFTWMPAQITVIAAILALLTITFGAYVLIHPLERRIKRMEQAVRLIRAGELSARANVEGRDEIGQLASAFNGMAEHIQRLISSQREMVRAVSHELRTPVARVRFGMEMLADTESAQDRQEQLKAIDADVEELNQLIDEILTYARLEEAAPRLKVTHFDLPALLERVRTETEALKTGLVIRVQSEIAELPASGELRYIHRVIQNLAGNATRYARKCVLLSCGQSENSVWIAVEDDGPGIPVVDRERIFQPFARLDDSRTRASGGHGLGLSIVQRIAFWHEGNVLVDSSPVLGGARFVMTWPKRLSESVTISTNSSLD